MPPIDASHKPPLREQVMQEITKEITKLSDQQNDAIKQASFIGMTDAETRQYNRRAARIRDLVEELTMVYPRKVEDPGGHCGQATQETPRNRSESH